MGLSFVSLAKPSSPAIRTLFAKLASRMSIRKLATLLDLSTGSVALVIECLGHCTDVLGDSRPSGRMWVGGSAVLWCDVMVMRVIPLGF